MNKTGNRLNIKAKTHSVLLCFLDKEGLPIISKLHLQLHSFSIDLYVNLQNKTE